MKLLFQMVMKRIEHLGLLVKVITIKYSERKFFLVYDQQLCQVYTFHFLCSNSFLVGKNQGLRTVSDIMILLGEGGFFRDNGVNSLPSVKHISNLLNDPNTFKNVSYKSIKTSSFVKNSKFSV